MLFQRGEELYNRKNLFNFDIYPKVLVEGKKATLHLINRGYRNSFTSGKEYTIEISGYANGNHKDNPNIALYAEEKAVCDEKGGFTFSHTFPKETEYNITVKSDTDSITVSVYCVAEDLKGRYPFLGDLHMHTCLSDGQNTPETVSATYRSEGYDFFAITDHHRYYPSLRAINFFKDFPMEFVIVPGEEIHLPPVNGINPNIHIVNFGGEYSINALIQGPQYAEVGGDKKYRAIREDVPDVMTVEEYEKKMSAAAEQLEVPENVEPIQAAVYRWIFSEIKKANGLGIFAHPTWIWNHAFNASDADNDYLVENRLFDAFEVLGGERNFEQNGFQTVRYYEDKAKGYRYPIVGSTDSHGCFPTNHNATVCSTIIFSPENERKALIQSVKDFYSVAVDTISKEFRLVGDMRLIRYGSFLIQNYFPHHNELCFEEGRLMLQYTIGTEEEKQDALQTMKTITGRMEKLRRKYFDFD